MLEVLSQTQPDQKCVHNGISLAKRIIFIVHLYSDAIDQCVLFVICCFFTYFFLVFWHTLNANQTPGTLLRGW